MRDSRGIEYFVHNGKDYYNQKGSSDFLGMTLTGFRRKREKLEKEDGIIVPLVILPLSDQMRFIDKRVLDVLNKSIRVGEEEHWKEEARKVIQEVNSEEG